MSYAKDVLHARVDAFVADLRRLCVRHGFVLDAACLSEGVGGELLIIDADDNKERRYPVRDNSTPVLEDGDWYVRSVAP